MAPAKRTAAEGETLRLALIVPTLNEEPALARNLRLLATAADELVVSDGGSSDATVAMARAAGATVVEGAPGRGPQLNRGAAASGADVLFFVHADSLPPPDAADRIRGAIASGYEGGGFLVAFDGDGGWQRVGTRLVNLRTQWTLLPLGDQGQFLTREAFDALGGFRDWPILEDLDLIRRLKRRGRPAVLPGPVRTSFRRYRERGIGRTIVTNWLIWALYLGGVSPHRLARLYRTVR